MTIRTFGSEFVGNIWENGEYGVAASKATSKGMQDHTDQILRNDEQVQWMLNVIKVHGIEAALLYAREYYPNPLGEENYRQDGGITSPLDLTTLPNSHKRVARGEKGITTYGRRLVRNACYRLEREVRKEALSFLTVTLPDVSVEESILISKNWGEVVRQFQQSLKRALVAQGLPGEIVGVTEIQSKRFAETGVFALHLHLVFQGRKPYGHWALQPEMIRLYWRNALRKYLSRNAHSYDWRYCENIVRVKKSVEQYLGKYMSKGVAQVKEIHESEIDYVFPSSWYLCSLSLRERVHNRVIRLAGVPASHLIDISSSEAYEYLFRYRRPVVLSTEGLREITIGWYGRLSEEGYDYLQDLFIEHAIERDETIDKFLTV